MPIAPSIDVKACKTVHPPHPCDEVKPCDPHKESEGECQPPVLCLERIKNPALPGEITKCKPGNYMNVKTCSPQHPPHPCDTLPPCSTTVQKIGICPEPALCLPRIKNPEGKKPSRRDCDTSL